MTTIPTTTPESAAPTSDGFNGRHEGNGQVAPSVSAAWVERAPDLAAWTQAKLVNRTDVWGGYYIDDDTNVVESWTAPAKKKRGKESLTEDRIKLHFSLRATRNRIGLHATSTENTCRWVAIDIDAHGDEITAELRQANIDAALWWYEKLSGLKFHPLLTTSNGAGGYHLRVIFMDPVPSAQAFAFIKNIVSDWQSKGLAAEPEVFPKQAKLGNGQFGNWLRLCGRHHKRDHHTTVFDGDQWLKGNDAIEFILSHTGDNPELLPKDQPKQKEKKSKPKKERTRSVSSSSKDKLKLIEALKILKPARAENYDSWIRVGLVCHREFKGASAGLELWDDWSRQGATYKEGECAAKWAGFKEETDNPVGLGTILAWAKEDGKEELAKALRIIEGAVRNFDTEEVPPPQDAPPGTPPGEREFPLTIPEIIGRIKEATDGWPRRANSALFIHEDGQSKVAWLEKTNALFGWLNSRTGLIHWHNNNGEVTGYASHDEVFHEVLRTAQAYDAIEAFPHEPRLPGHYYLCGDVEPGDGSRLREFVRFFAPATDVDHDLIFAFVLSLFWGGPPGVIPCFAITSDDGRGVGKSTLAMLIAELVGGYVDISPNEAIRDIKERLLSPDGLTKRMALIDNLKSLKFSFGELEGLVTGKQISGRRMYCGEASRPNNLVWATTLNGANFSEDMAQRYVVIKIVRQKNSPAFHEQVSAFIAEHGKQIVSDAIGILRSEPYELSSFSRWNLWEKHVLAHVAEPTECQQVIAERQKRTNVDADEVEIVEDFVAEQLASLNYQPEVSVVYIPSGILAGWYSKATNDRDARTPRVGRLIGQWIDEKKAKCLFRDTSHNRGARGWIWRGEMADPTSNANTEIESRINHRDEGRRFSR